MVTFLLLVIGGLNWLIFGIWGTELGTWIGGMDSTIARIIYILVGVAAIIEVACHKKLCVCCGKSGCGCGGSCGGKCEGAAK